MQTKSMQLDEQCKDSEQTSSQLPNTPHITLLDDDDEEDDDVPLAKLSRISKRQEGKGKKSLSQQRVSPIKNVVAGTSGNSSKGKSARRLGKAIKQE